MRLSLFCIAIILYSLSANSQGFSNKGKDFWVAYGYHVRMSQNSAGGGGGGGGSNLNNQDMVLYFATEEATTITISIPGTGYTQVLTSGPIPTVLTSNPIPKAGAQDARLTRESLTPENKGIHITSDKPIVAYAHIYDQSVSGATILFPTPTLGKEYYSINYTNISNEDSSNSWVYFIATDTGTTTVEVTPSGNTAFRVANVPFTVNLTQGQVYILMGKRTANSGGGGGGGGGGVTYNTVDLTGTKIKSIASGSGGCKRIAVFSGSGKLSLTCSNTTSSADNYMVQAFPKDAWGKKFLTVPTKSLNNNVFRICVLDTSTLVTVNGAPIGLPLTNRFYYQLARTSSPLRIESNLPITVAQYIATQGTCGNPSSNTNPGDPEVIYLSPVEQNISRVLWNATPNYLIVDTQHYFNAVIPNAGTALTSFKLDGNVLGPAAFTVHPQDPSYSFISTRLSGPGVHVIESDSGFNAIAYGFGVAESYGYNAGTNIRDLYNKLEPLNPLSISQDAVACKGTPLFLSVTFPFQPTSLFWDFKGNPFQSPNTNVTVSNPIADTTYFVGTKQVWRYKLPTLYNFSLSSISPGYPITITAGTTSSEGCGGSVEREFFLEVYDPPVVRFKWQNNGCVNDPVQFTDSTIYNQGTYSYLWTWQFGDGATDNTHNPGHLFNTAGTYNVNFALTTNVGCQSDTTIAVTVDPLPVATLSANTAYCLNAPNPSLVFNATAGTSPYVFNYSVNGGIQQSLTSSTDSATINIPTNVVGPITYSLISVKGGSCLQNQTTAPLTVTINPLPSASISGTRTVCQNAPSPNIIFKGSGATAPYTFTYNINGGPSLTVVSQNGDSASVPVPTSTVGTFTYNLTSVTDASNTFCSNAQAGSAQIIVQQLPTATVQGALVVCQNDSNPTITFTGANGTAPYTFVYSINGGAAQTITTITGNAATVPAPTQVAGTFTYALINVQESSANQCSNTQNGQTSIVVNPLPAPNFTTSSPVCEERQINLLDQTNPNASGISSWQWNFGDGSAAVVAQSPIHTYSYADTFNVSLTTVNTNGCRNVITKPVVIHPNPQAGFINPEVCLSDTYAQFDDTSTVAYGSITQWLWDFGDPGSGALNNSTQSDPRHSYNSLGQKNIKLIIKSDQGCVDTLFQSFTINGDLPVSGLQVIAPTGLCANDSVAIRNISSVNVGSIVKVQIIWDQLGAPQIVETDDIPFPGKIYKHLYPNFQTPATNSYQIKFIAYSGISCKDSTNANITINAAPLVRFDPISDTCYYIDPFQLTQASESGSVPGTFRYTGTGVSNSGIFSPALAGVGTHALTYIYTSNSGCIDSASQSIRILQAPVAHFGISAPACANNAITFTDSSSSSTGNVVLWTWNYGDGSAPQSNTNNNSVSHIYTNTGVYPVSLMVRTSEGCNSRLFSDSLLINPNPVADFRFTDTACLPDAFIQFANTSTISDGTQNTFIYNWNFGDPGSGSNSSSGINPSHVYSGTGPYLVQLNVRSGAGCIDDTTIEINTIHPQPIADIDFSLPNVCIGDQVQMLDISNPQDGSASQWQWNFGDGTSSGLQNPNHTYGNPGTYTVTLIMTNSFGCESTVDTDTFTVYDYPVISAGPDLQILEGYGMPLQATASGINLQYLWTSANYLNDATLLNPVCTPLADIEYTLTVTGIGGCASSDIMKVTLLKLPLIPNTFSPNNDGINDLWEIEYLKLYPHPRVQVFTRTGQLVFESKDNYNTPWDGTKNGKPLPMDTYYYIVEPGSGRPPFTGYVTIIK